VFVCSACYNVTGSCFMMPLEWFWVLCLHACTCHAVVDQHHDACTSSALSLIEVDASLLVAVTVTVSSSSIAQRRLMALSVAVGLVYCCCMRVTVATHPHPATTDSTGIEQHHWQAIFLRPCVSVPLQSYKGFIAHSDLRQNRPLVLMHMQHMQLLLA
jgi:hypothetical protein